MAFEFSTRFTKGLKYSLTGGTICKALASPVAAAVTGFTIETFDTESNILASTPANNTIAFGTDTHDYYIYRSGLGWAIFNDMP